MKEQLPSFEDFKNAIQLKLNDNYKLVRGHYGFYGQKMCCPVLALYPQYLSEENIFSSIELKCFLRNVILGFDGRNMDLNYKFFLSEDIAKSGHDIGKSLWDEFNNAAVDHTDMGC